MDEKKLDFIANQREKTPPMLLNEVSRLCMATAGRMHGEQSRVQHSARIILVRLTKEDGQTQAELVRASKMTPPSISATLKNMEAEGLIMRKKDEADQRITRVYLTDLGRAAEEKNYQIIRQVDALAMEGITESEQKALVEVLLKMRDNLTRELRNKNEA